jgi:hypothetical protein
MTPPLTLFTPPRLPDEVVGWLPRTLVAPMPGPPDTLSDLGGLWWICLVSSVALAEFYDGLGGRRLDNAFRRMMDQAKDGLDQAGGRDDIHRACSAGDKLGTEAALNRHVELLSVVPWWASGIRASFAIAALVGLDAENLHEPLVNMATHHHRAWRAGMTVVLDDEGMAQAVISGACGELATDWIRVLAVAIEANRRAR